MGNSVELSLFHVLIDLFLIIIFGIVLYIIIPSQIKTERRLDNASVVAIGTLVYIGIATSGIETIKFTALVPILFVTVGLLVASFIFIIVVGEIIGLHLKEITGLYFGSTMKNLGVAIAIASTISISGLVMPIIVFYATQQLFSALIVSIISDS